MASILEGSLKATIAQKFQGKLLVGTISRRIPSALDAYGDAVPGTTQTFTFTGIREHFSAMYIAKTGIPDQDVRILILLGSVKPVTIPKQGDFIYIGVPPRWHQFRKVLEVDPAGASMSVQATEIGDLPP